MPCNSCKKPKFEQAKISPLLARYQKFKNTPQKVNSSINRTPVKKPSRVFTTSKPKTSTIDRRREILKKLNANKSKKVTLSSSTLLQIKSIEKGWIKVPSWFKNNVEWVKQGKISESEFNRGLQSAITQANQNRVTKPIQNTPTSVPVNTTPVIESIPEVVKKDCGWFGEKCAFDGVTKAFDEAGKGLDVFVKEEQKKQDASWNWFNTGVKETQDGIANFFENEGKKQKESWQALDDSVESTKNWVDSGIIWFEGGIEIEQKKQEQTVNDIINYPAQLQKQLDDKLKKIDVWQKEQGRLRDEAFSNALENAQLGVDGIITGVSDLGGDITGAFDEFGAGITQFGTDVSTNIGALGTGLDQFGKDLQTNVAGIGEGLDQFGKDMQKNIMILGVVGLGAVVLMGMRK